MARAASASFACGTATFSAAPLREGVWQLGPQFGVDLALFWQFHEAGVEFRRQSRLIQIFGADKDDFLAAIAEVYVPALFDVADVVWVVRPLPD